MSLTNLYVKTELHQDLLLRKKILLHNKCYARNTNLQFDLL